MDKFSIGVPYGTPFPVVELKRDGTLVYDIESVKKIFVDAGVDWNDVRQGHIEDFLLKWYFAIRATNPNPVMEKLIMEAHNVN